MRWVRSVAAQFFALGSMILVRTLSVHAQDSTNHAPPLSWFVVPNVELRHANAEQKPEAIDSDTFTVPASMPEDMDISSKPAEIASEISVQAYEAMNGSLVLSRIEQPAEPAGAIGWVETRVWDPVFAPEVVTLGKIKVTGGVVAAIKRKNPFCLLHPFVFGMGW